MTPILVGLAGLLALLGAILIHIPVPVAMILVGSVGYLLLTDNFFGIFAIIGAETVSMLTNKDFAVVMPFLLMGAFSGVAGLSKDIYRFANAWIGHFRGGLAMATVAGCGMMGSISGSSIATTVTMARIALPEMEARRYRLSLATGTLAAGGTLGALIPPSIIMVVYAVQAEQFVVDLFLAAIIPGILSILMFFVAIRLYLVMNPNAAAAAPRESWKGRARATQKSFTAVGIIVVVLGGIYTGMLTVNEGAAVGLVLTLMVAFWRRTLGGRTFWATLAEAAGAIALLYFILIGANVFSYFLTLSQMPAAVVDWVRDLGLSPLSVIFMLVLMYLILGAVFDAIAGMLITMPFVFPLVISLGYDPVWWGIVNVMIIEIAMITPPVGINVFVLRGLRQDIGLWTIYRGVWPFLLANLLVLLAIILFPDIVLWLPQLVFG